MKRTYVKGRKLNPKTIFWASTGEFQCQKQKEFWVYARKILSELPIIWETIKIRAALEVTTSLKIAWYSFKIGNSWAIWFMSHKISSSWGNNTNPKDSHWIPWKHNSIPVPYNSSEPETLLSLRWNPSFLICQPTLQLMWNDQNQYVSKQKDMENWEQECFQLWLMGGTDIVILKTKNILKGNLLSRIMEKDG